MTGATADGVVSGHYVEVMVGEGDGKAVESRFLTLRDVGVYLNVSEAQVYALVRSGELPAINLGGRGVWRVDRHKLDAYLERLQEETQAWMEAHPLNPREREKAQEGEDDEEGSVLGRSLRAATSTAKAAPESPEPLGEGEEAVSAVEAAAIMGVTRQNVHHLIKTGRLRARKQAGRWVVSAEDARSYRPLGNGDNRSFTQG